MVRRLSPRVGWWLIPLVAVCPLLGGEGARKAREFGQNVSAGTAKGGVLPAVVAVQQDRAVAAWSKQFADEKPPFQEASGYLLFGTVAGKKLPEVAPVLERAQALALKTLELDGDYWQGKLSVFFVGDRLQYSGLVRTLERRRAEEGEPGCIELTGDDPHVIVGAARAKTDLNPDIQAAAQIASAMLLKKNANAPEWIAQAFGRATAIKAAGPAQIAVEHKRAYAMLNPKKRTLKEVIAGSLDPDETAVLRASVLEYLAYSGRTAKFMPFLKGFQVGENMETATLEAALTSANLPMDTLDQVWQKWVRTLK